MKLTPRQQEVINAYTEHGTQQKAADVLGVSRRYVRKVLAIYNNQTLNSPMLGFKTVRVSTDGNGKITSSSQKIESDIDDVVRDGKVIRRSTLYNADGSVANEWVIRKPEDIVQDEYLAALETKFKEVITPLEPSNGDTLITSNSNDLVVILSIDEHIGVRLVKEQVGEDLSLAETIKLMKNSFLTLLERAPSANKCLYVNLGDQFHANDHLDVTPGSKHTLFSDSSFNTIADAVIELNRFRITKLLEKYNSVDIRGVAGNHDVDPMGWLFRCYDILYENEPRVTSKFWSTGLGVYQFGKTMLGFHHGHKMKAEVMAGAAADRFPEVYGSTTMRYLHTGHVHHDGYKDVWGGFKWYSHRTMIPKDEFSYSNGYVSRQSMQGYLYNKNEGEVATFTTTYITH